MVIYNEKPIGENLLSSEQITIELLDDFCLNNQIDEEELFSNPEMLLSCL